MVRTQEVRDSRVMESRTELQLEEVKEDKIERIYDQFVLESIQPPVKFDIV
jgi:hypothetical protein